ncbi:MAG TPA: plastocyanin/azurin family copper-binding protein, partial [Limnochordales bacterium]
MRYTTRVLLVAAVLLALMVGWLEGEPPLPGIEVASTAADASQDETVTVVIRNLRFQPDELRVKPGTRVVFANEDDVVHNVVHAASQRVGAAPPLFESPVLNPGDTWSFVFNEPGEYPIVCTVSAHQLMGMVGKIIVA